MTNLYRSIVCTILVASLLLSAASQAIASAPPLETPAKQAIMIDASTNSVLFAKDADVAMHPSSMSKLMTIYVLFQRMKAGRVKLDDKFKVSEKAWRTQGSKTFVPIGEEITVEELIHGIIIQSGNDACIVLAEGLGGSEEAFVAEMNRIAKEIGLENSHFVNSTGLPEEEHLMTSRDLATLSARLINDFPEYYHYFSIREYTYNGIHQQNRNRLIGSLGVDGLKTGHTEAAGYGISLSAKQGDRRLILVVNGLESEKQREEEGDRLLRYGFREFETRTLLHKGTLVDHAPVWFGKQEQVPLLADGEIVMTLPINAPPNMSAKLKYTGPLPAPVVKGTHVADLIVTHEGSEPHIIPLVAGADVEKLSGIKRLMALIDYHLHGKP